MLSGTSGTVRLLCQHANQRRSHLGAIERESREEDPGIAFGIWMRCRTLQAKADLGPLLSGQGILAAIILHGSDGQTFTNGKTKQSVCRSLRPDCTISERHTLIHKSLCSPPRYAHHPHPRGHHGSVSFRRFDRVSTG